MVLKKRRQVIPFSSVQPHRVIERRATIRKIASYLSETADLVLIVVLIVVLASEEPNSVYWLRRSPTMPCLRPALEKSSRSDKVISSAVPGDTTSLDWDPGRGKFTPVTAKRILTRTAAAAAAAWYNSPGPEKYSYLPTKVTRTLMVCSRAAAV